MDIVQREPAASQRRNRAESKSKPVPPKNAGAQNRQMEDQNALLHQRNRRSAKAAAIARSKATA